MSRAPLDALLGELALREVLADDGGGRARQERQRRLGRLTARERLAALIDPGSFVELGRHVKSRHGGSSPRLAANLHPGDGLICGLASIDGHNAAVYAHDPTVLRGALGRAGSQKLCRLLELAYERRLPVLALVDSDGARVEEGTDAVLAIGELLGHTYRLKGRVPQLTLACGLCVGGAAYTAVSTDLLVMIRAQSFMFVTGGKVAKVVTGQDVELADLGPPELHARATGACHAIVEDELAGIALLRRVLAFARPTLATNVATELVPGVEALVPTEPRRGYDARKLIDLLCDEGTPTELSALYAPNLLTSLARLGGRAIAVVASQPMVLAGCLDVAASRKGAAFIRWAGAMGLPVLTLVDTPGYLPGRAQEEAGILPHGAELLGAYAAARVPKLCLIVRKSIGGASVLSYAADLRYALPTARIDVMGPLAAVEVCLGPALSEEADADQRAEDAAERARFLARHDTVWTAAEAGYIDRVVRPAEARRELSAALERLCADGKGS